MLPAPANILPSPAGRNEISTFLELIPHRKEDPADNPLAPSVVIEDEHTRRFYAAINDRRTVREICILAHLERKEVAIIARKLLAQYRIELYEPDGRVVERSSIFDEH